MEGDKILLTPQEFSEKMSKLIEKLEDEDNIYYDKEQFHKDADALLCETLCGLGYEEGVKKFINTPKWYA